MLLHVSPTPAAIAASKLQASPRPQNAIWYHASPAEEPGKPQGTHDCLRARCESHALLPLLVVEPTVGATSQAMPQAYLVANLSPKKARGT